MKTNITIEMMKMSTQRENIYTEKVELELWHLTLSLFIPAMRILWLDDYNNNYGMMLVGRNEILDTVNSILYRVKCFLVTIVSFLGALWYVEWKLWATLFMTSCGKNLMWNFLMNKIVIAIFIVFYWAED